MSAGFRSDGTKPILKQKEVKQMENCATCEVFEDPFFDPAYAARMMECIRTSVQRFSDYMQEALPAWKDAYAAMNERYMLKHELGILSGRILRYECELFKLGRLISENHWNVPVSNHTVNLNKYLLPDDPRRDSFQVEFDLSKACPGLDLMDLCESLDIQPPYWLAMESDDDTEAETEADDESSAF